MKLESVDTKKFLEDPKKEDFERRMANRSPVFKLKIDKVNTKKALTYITLVYDKDSYFRKDIKEYYNRKKEAAICAGFKFDNSFHPVVEKVLLGENESFNKAVVQYVSLMYDNDYKQLVVLEYNFNKLMFTAYTSWDDKVNKLIEDMRKKIEYLENKIFGGNETINARKALYEGTEQTRLKLRPEDVVDEYVIDGLMDWSPYGKSYKPEPLHFIGELPPQK